LSEHTRFADTHTRACALAHTQSAASLYMCVRFCNAVSLHVQTRVKLTLETSDMLASEHGKCQILYLQHAQARSLNSILFRSFRPQTHARTHASPTPENRRPNGWFGRSHWYEHSLGLCAHDWGSACAKRAIVTSHSPTPNSILFHRTCKVL
jgi:hypothetical protein